MGRSKWLQPTFGHVINLSFVLPSLSRLRALAFDMHAAPISAEESSAALQRWAGGFPMGLCGLSHLTELDISLRAFDRPAIVLPEVWMHPLQTMHSHSSMSHCLPS